MEKHEALNNLTDEVLDTRRERFIQEVINHYDMVEIGTLYFGDMAIDVESIYYDKAEHRLMVHISSKEMEGDIIYTSLQREKQGKLVELVFEEMKCLEEGPTLLGMMIDGSNILYRNVFIKEQNAEVKVTTEEVFEAHIEEGSPDEEQVSTAMYRQRSSSNSMTLNLRNTSTRNSKGNGQTRSTSGRLPEQEPPATILYDYG